MMVGVLVLGRDEVVGHATSFPFSLLIAGRVQVFSSRSGLEVFMRVIMRAVLFVFLSLVIWAGDWRLRDSSLLGRSAAAGISQVNGGQDQWDRLQAIEREKSLLNFGAGAATAVAGLVCFGTMRRRPGIRYVPHQESA
jgi:hypothetical protein